MNLKCRVCKLDKPKTEMQQDRKSPGGIRNVCKICGAISSRQSYAKHRQERLKTQREYNAKKTVKSTTNRKQAWIILHVAFKNGSVKRCDTCAACGSTIEIHAHHVDYSRPFYIAWLCRQCHSAAHRKYDPLDASPYLQEIA